MSTNNTPAVDWRSEVEQAVLAMKEEGQKAYTFMKQEAPEVAREYVAWQVVRGFTLSVPPLLASAVAVGISIKAYRTWNKERIEIAKSWERGEWGFGCIAALVVACILFGTAVKCCEQSVKALVAPRIVVLEGIKEVVR